MRMQLCWLILTICPAALGFTADPVRKVLQMLSNLETMVVTKTKDAQKSYDDYVSYCQKRSQNIAFNIKSGKALHASLEAKIDEENANAQTFEAKLEDLAADISSNENELESAAALRKREHADFAAEEKDLTEIIDSLERAISHFSKSSGASMLQLNGASSITEALQVMVDATAMSSEESSRLMALVQQRSLQDSEDAESEQDADFGAPAAAVRERKSTGIVDTLESLYERADEKLNEIRKAESTALQNYDILHQSLNHEIKFSKDDMSKAKVSLAESKEAKSQARGDLELTTKDLKGDVVSKEMLHHECMNVAQQFESTSKNRHEQLAAIAAAKKAISAIGAAPVQPTDEADSFIQLSRSGVELASSKAQIVRTIRKLASKTKSASLAQLASRISSTLKLSSKGGRDPFRKIKGLITDMISQLEAEAEQEAQHKEYCDKEMAATQSAKEDVSSQLDHLTSQKKQKDARSVKLREEVSMLQKELVDIAKTKAEVSQLRKEEEKNFKQSKADMEQGLKGIRLAIKILKDYYGSNKGDGSEVGIINLLEAVESDFSKGLTGLIVDEDTAANYFKTETMPNIEEEQAAKEQDMKYKTKDYMSINKVISETAGDISGVRSRLDAINTYDAGIQKSCIAQPSSYDESQKRRESEIAGLREALASLQGDAFIQIGNSRRLRGQTAERHM